MNENPYRAPVQQSRAPTLKVGDPAPPGELQFLLSGRDRNWRWRTARVDAASADVARNEFSQLGYTEIVLHTDDVSALFVNQKQYQRRVRPADYVRLQRTGGFWQRVWFSVRLTYTRPWRAWLTLGAILLLLYFLGSDQTLLRTLLALTLVLPLALAVLSNSLSWVRHWERAANALSWGRWERALAALDRLRGKLGSLAALSRAKALAGLGRRDEALQVMQSLSTEPNLPRWLGLLRLAEIYVTLDQRDAALTHFERALAAGPANATLLLSVAWGRIELAADTHGARELLSLARSHAVAESIQGYASQVEGLILLAEKQPYKATGALRKSIVEYQPFAQRQPGHGRRARPMPRVPGACAQSDGRPALGARHLAAGRAAAAGS